MKKNNYLLLILSILLFFGCRQENLYVDQDTQNNSALKNYVINGNEIKKDVELWSKLSGIQTHFFAVNIKNKKNDPLLDGAVIMTDYAGVMEKNGVTTYTFSIKRMHSSKDIENLVVRKNPDGSYSGVLMQYHLSKQELQTYQHAGKPEDIKGKISVYKIDDINLNSKSGSGGYTYSEQVGCLVINFEVIPCTSDDQHTNPNQCALTGVDSPQIILLSVDDSHCTPSGNPGTGSSGTGTIPGGNQSGGSSGSSPSDPDANPYNTFIFNSYDDMQNICATGDDACEADRQLNLQVQAYLLSLSPITSTLAAYNPILKTIKDYFKVYGYADDALTDRLVLTANWFNAQNNTNPDLTLSNFKVASWALTLLIENDTEDFQNFFNRLTTLDNAVIQNPNLLLDIPCDQLPAWNIVANHQVPQALKNKLNNVQGQTNWFNSWEIQNIDNAFGPKLNMDLFPTRITNMPNKPGTNQKYTPAEFFEYFRKNINSFVDPNLSQFHPIVEPVYGLNETDLWNSSNPLGALVTIGIPGDNGTVMCTGYNGEAWVFTTVKAPIKLDGIHPVSGHRLFGYWVDNNGFMYLFTRGVDRFTKPVPNNTLNYLIESLAFSQADKLWNSMQTKIVDFVNNPLNGGLANKLEPVTYRPAYMKIRNYLKGTANIQSLGCN